MKNLLFFLFLAASAPDILAFKSNYIHSANSGRLREKPHVSLRRDRSSSSDVVRRSSSSTKDDTSSSASSSDGVEKRLSAASTPTTEITIDAEPSSPDESSSPAKAATNTINDRLLTELQESIQTQKYGPTSSSSSRRRGNYLQQFRYSTAPQTPEERERSLREARDLNGVNPLVCLGGAAFAWGCAGILWVFTTYLGVVFASHPVVTEAYFVQRVVGVFRNAVMGLSSLASGFFGVVGVGIFLLGVRVGYGVLVGELDPTPVKRREMDEVEMPDVWGLMMGKTRRRGRR